MKFAICNETFQDWEFERAFSFARECGYTGIEIAPFTMSPDAHDISQARRREVAAQAQQAGLEVVGLHWLLAKTEGYYLTSPDPEVRKRTSSYLGELARLCRDLDGSILVLGSPQQRNLLPGVTKSEAMGYATEVIQGALPLLEEAKVTLAVEPLGPSEGDFLLTAAEGVELIQMVDSPHCKLHLDCKAMSSETQPIGDIVDQYRGYLVHFHANDPNRLGPGFGDLDFIPIFESLLEIRYQGWVSVEVFDYTPGVERLARESMEYMQASLRQASQ